MSFASFNRIDFLSKMIPLWKGERRGFWLDACTPFRSVPLSRVAHENNWLLTVADIEPRVDDVVQTDLQKYDETIGFYQLITCTDTLEHIHDYPAAIHNLYRYALIGAYVIIGVPIQEDRTIRHNHVHMDPTPENGNHAWDFNPELLRIEIGRYTGFELTGEYRSHQLDVNEFGNFYFLRKRK